jgi:tRNA(Ile)-lysidine synthase
LEWVDQPFVVAVSGGADSTALLLALSRLSQLRSKNHDSKKIVVAHFNHGLRGAESDADQEFVKELADRLKAIFVSRQHVIEKPKDIVHSSENQLRDARYAFLIEVAHQHHASWIAMGHHADDQVETFLHHLLRGSGPRGLSGIPSTRDVSSTCKVIRPLLNVTRNQIVAYLEDLEQPFRNDVSNLGNDYTRNRIRNELLPMLRAFAGNEVLDARLLQACNLIAREHELVSSLASSWLERVESNATNASQGNCCSIPINKMVDTPWPVIREGLNQVWLTRKWPLREMNTKHWERLEALIDYARQSPHPRQQELPGGIRASVRQGYFLIEKSS